MCRTHPVCSHMNPVLCFGCRELHFPVSFDLQFPSRFSQWKAWDHPGFWGLVILLPRNILPSWGWEEFPIVAKLRNSSLDSMLASQLFYFLGNQFRISNFFYWRNLEWLLFFWSESLTGYTSQVHLSVSGFEIPLPMRKTPQDSFI